MNHPLPAGTRVHHRGCLWSYGFTEKEHQDRPSWGWATVLEAVPQRDGTVEYRVRSDAPVIEGSDPESWWASYHIDQADSSATRSLLEDVKRAAYDAKIRETGGRPA